MLKKALFMTAILAGLFAPPALANPILLMPTGRTLTTGQVRAEAALGPSGADRHLYLLAAGTPLCEINFTRIQNGEREENLYGLQWGFLPETSFTPAVSFGLTDIASQSARGIGIYAAITHHLPVGPGSVFLKSFALTTGVGAAGIHGPFVGFQAKLPLGFFAEAEYDTSTLNAAAGWQPIKYLRFKAYTLQHNFYLGAQVPPISF